MACPIRMKIGKDQETVQGFLSDESNIFSAPAGMVKAVYFPETGAEVKKIIKGANRTGTLVTVSGGGTGITGSRVPLHGGIVISMERMLNTPLYPELERMEYKGLAGDLSFYLDRERNTAHLPPGISIRELAGALPNDLFYPPDPTETSAFLGGTIATNASGARSFHYGATRRWVEGLRVVLGNADTLAIARGETFADENGALNFESESGTKYCIDIPHYTMPPVKNAAGLYSKPGMDLIDLFIGSEGILGVFTEIEVRLEPRPEMITDISFFGSEHDSLSYVDELRKQKEKGIMSIEFFDEHSLAFIRKEYPEIKEGVKAAVLVEMVVKDYELMQQLSEIQANHHAKDDWCAHTVDTTRALKEFRHALPDGVNAYLKQHRSYKLGTDLAVPPGKFSEMMKAYKAAGERFKGQFPREGMHHTLFGHIGDNHLHFNFITHDLQEQAFAKKLYYDLARKAVELGGTISGEHGVGKKTVEIDGVERPYLELMYGPDFLNDISSLKKVFDPKNILNVGNIIPGG